MEGEDRYNIFKSLSEEELNFRFYWHFPSDQLDQIIEDKQLYFTDSQMINTVGMKIFMDGSLGSHTAYMFDPYPDSDNYGRCAMSFEPLEELILKAADSGIPSTVHSIGDRCSYELLKIFSKVKRKTGSSLRHRIEHLQALRPEDLDLLKESGVCCAIQPVHMKADIKYIDKLWSKAAAYAFPLRSLMDNGLIMGFSSDAPVETINPFEGVYSALERRYNNDPANPVWLPEQRLRTEEILKAYTWGSAYISQAEKYCGSLEVGKSADLFILDNFFEKNNNFWLTAKSKFTMIRGEIVYSSI
jgi:hypothetical protein